MPVIEAGYSTLGSILFGQASHNTLNYFDSVREKIATKAGAYREEFLQTGQQIYDSVYSARALELARAAINKAGALFAPDIVKELRTMSEFQTAKPVMQRWVMANPMVRQMWMDRRCDGYSDSYVDFHPGAIGEDHYDYRRVMDGVTRQDEKTGEWFRKIYREELREGDQPLDPSEQIDIIHSYVTLENFMKLAAKDPTNEWNGDL